MLALISIGTYIVLAAGPGSSDGFSAFWDNWLNYPGFEVWKFVNLFAFVGILVYILKKPLSEAFRTRRETIRAELIKAEEAKKAALVMLTEIEAKLAAADSERTRILKEAKAEIEQEKARLIEQATAEANKLDSQVEGEINRIGQVARLQLRRFAVEESIRRAEDKLRTQVDQNTDARLIRSGIEAIGGLS